MTELSDQNVGFQRVWCGSFLYIGAPYSFPSHITLSALINHNTKTKTSKGLEFGIDYSYVSGGQRCRLL